MIFLESEYLLLLFLVIINQLFTGFFMRFSIGIRKVERSTFIFLLNQDDSFV